MVEGPGALKQIQPLWQDQKRWAFALDLAEGQANAHPSLQLPSLPGIHPGGPLVCFAFSLGCLPPFCVVCFAFSLGCFPLCCVVCLFLLCMPPKRGIAEGWYCLLLVSCCCVKTVNMSIPSPTWLGHASSSCDSCHPAEGAQNSARSVCRVQGIAVCRRPSPVWDQLMC